MPLLTHAVVTIAGDPALRTAFQEHVTLALGSEYPEVSWKSVDTATSSIFDLKTEHGIPFPPFVAASEAHPELAVRIEWVNAETESRGHAELQGGKIVAQSIESLPSAQSSLVYEAVDNGVLELAFTLLPTAESLFLGYAITCDKDALIRLARNHDRAELHRSTGSEPQWEERWELDLKAGSFDYAIVDPPEPMDAALFQALTARGRFPGARPRARQSRCASAARRRRGAPHRRSASTRSAQLQSCLHPP